MEWDFENYGFKIINWRFPKDDDPHCEIVLRINTGLEKIDKETYSFTNCSLPFDTELHILENLKKSIELAIDEIKEKTKNFKE